MLFFFAALNSSVMKSITKLHHAEDISISMVSQRVRASGAPQVRVFIKCISLVAVYVISRSFFFQHAGFDSNFAKSFPSKNTQAAFFTSYVRAVEKSRETQNGGDASTSSPGGERPTLSPLADDASFMAALTTEVNRWTLLSHLWWAAWAVVQARYSPIDFDFVDYARLRLAGYRLHKEAFFGGMSE